MCASSAIEKGEVEWGESVVCAFHRLSLVDGLVGFECRHLASPRWTPREGPNSCPTVVGVGVFFCVVGVVSFVLCCCCF